MKDRDHTPEEIEAAKEAGLIAPGAVIQVDPDHDTFGGCLAIVTRSRSWGVEAYVPLPKGERAHLRLKDGFKGAGWAIWSREA